MGRFEQTGVGMDKQNRLIVGIGMFCSWDQWPHRKRQKMIQAAVAHYQELVAKARAQNP